MCGIAGYYNKSGAPVGNTDTVLKMLDLQKHRGPDDRGVRTFSLKSQETREYPVGQPTSIENQFEGVVGFNRLSILDLSSNGHQPMSSSDGKVVLAFNGEIYNAFDFKSELEAGGYHFKSKSDTEVILALYLKYGFDEMIIRLNGMFAIVLVDVQQQKLFIARDRFGIKPMYIYETPEQLSFSSEIKSFLSIPGFKARLDSTKLDEFLIFRNLINDTLFKGVESLAPGSYRVYARDESRTIQFFNIDRYARDEAKDCLHDQLKKSVSSQLVSDVKLGCQLSGGIDSSLVTAIAKEIKEDDLLESVSIIFDNPFYNEENYMDQVAHRLNLKSHKFKLTSSYYLQHFENATWHYEAPLNHPNTIGIYLLSQQAKKYVTVLLSGEGADEVFGGYQRFAEVLHPYNIRTWASRLKKDKALKHWINYNSEAYRAIMGTAYMNLSMAEKLMPGFSSTTALLERKDRYANLTGSIFDKQVKYEMQTYLPDLLLRQDKMSMAHSIENRVPFLDNELVKASFGIPESQLIGNTRHGIQTKLALKKLTAQWFGEEFVYRSKGGFGIPLRDFFTDPLFEQYISDRLLPAIRERGIFNADKLENSMKNIANISSGQLDALWIMISFEAWANKYKV